MVFLIAIDVFFFSPHFSPFYRTEQLIITATDDKQWLRHDSGESIDSHLYGPVLRKDFLSQVLKLQLELESIVAFSEVLNETVTLEDICFSPLSPDNRNCTIQSVLNYYQNDQANLDKKVMDPTGFYVNADYIDHFSACTKDPLSVSDPTQLHTSCLGTYGGPIMPWVVLGGFPGLAVWSNVWAYN